jgi:thioredoxin 1
MDGKSRMTGSNASVGDATLQVALAGDRPVLVEFYADWCGPCRAVGPKVEELAKELHGRAEVIRYNVDQHQSLSQQFGVTGIPCFIAFKNGHESARQMGGIPKEMMRSMLGL